MKTNTAIINPALSYVANYYKNVKNAENIDEILTGYFAAYENNPEVVSLKKEINNLQKLLEEKTSMYSDKVATRYNSEFTPVGKDIVIVYEGSRSNCGTLYFDLVTGLPYTNNYKDANKIHVDCKSGTFSVVVGYSLPLAAAVVRKYKYSISSNNSKCSLTMFEEYLIGLLTRYSVKNISLNRVDEVEDSGYFPYGLCSGALGSICAQEFINLFYNLDRSISFSLNEFRTFVENNANFETILRTAPDDIMVKLLGFKSDKIGPIHATIGCSKAEMDYASNLGVLNEFVDFRRKINERNSFYGEENAIALIEQKTNMEWIDILDKMKHHEEDFRFYGISYAMNHCGTLLDSLILSYCGGDYPYHRSNMSNYYAFGKYCTYIIEGCINQGFTGIKNYVDTLKDYLSMCADLNTKPVLYSDYLKQTHDITSRNHKIKVSTEQEEVFKSRYKGFHKFERDGYSIIAPTCSADVSREGDSLNHCVASYIKRVIDGTCLIYFLRLTNTLEESLVTIEVRDGAIVQAKGAHNRRPNNKEHGIILEFAISRKLKMRV